MVADRTFWDGVADRYAASTMRDTQGYERTLARVAELLKPDMAVLELGCGTGTTALRLAQGVARYRATDLAPRMIAIARERHSESPVEGLDFEVATAEELTPPRGGYDAVLGFNYLHLVAGRPRTLAAIRTLLRPGGLFITKTPCLKELNALIRLAVPLLQWIGKAPDSIASLDEAMLTADIRTAGFTIEAVERHAARGRDFRPFIVARG